MERLQAARGNLVDEFACDVRRRFGLQDDDHGRDPGKKGRRA
jgi:hypothetical protein